MKYWVSLLVLFLFFNYCLGTLVNKKVDRNINLNSQQAKHALSIQLQNTGSSAVNEFELAFRKDQAEHLAYLEVTQDKVLLTTQLDSKKSSENTIYKVTLASPINAGSSKNVKVYAVFTKLMQPFPKAITQFEKQYVRYFDNHFFFSPYTTDSQTTTVKLSSPTIEDRSDKPPTTVKGDTITYGPYNDVKPFSYSEMKIHFENNRPFLTAHSLVKEIEISHWGNVAIEETYEIEHTGAQLKGTFSRYDYQRNPGSSPSVISKFSQILPAGASDVYYRDEIGNVTTSNLRPLENGESLLELTPRFPLFGGWKFGFYMGYNLPSYLYLFKDSYDSSLYMLNITFAAKFEDMVVDHLIVRVILPEGAKNIEYFTPFSVDSTSFASHFTYLDTSGRPVLILEKKNVVSAHNQYFQVTYNFSSFSLLQEPFLLIGVFFLFFLLVMAYVRVEFSIGKSP